MNNITIFQNQEFGELRTCVMNGETYFLGKDVGVALGYKNQQQAVRLHVDNEDKGVLEFSTPGGKQQATFINESGLYALILSSKLESARRFKRRVTSEVLPSIRKQGGYIFTRDEAQQMRRRQGITSGNLSSMLGMWRKRGYIESHGPEVAPNEAGKQQFIKTERYLKQ